MSTAPVSTKDIEELFEAGLHLGHKKNRLHPKARKYVYRIEKGVSIIDLTTTLKQLVKAKQFMEQAKKEGKILLVAATKKVAKKKVDELSTKYDIAHVSVKWPPGLLTNFDTVIKNVKKIKELQEEKGKADFEKLPKHERSRFNKKLARLDRFYGGLMHLEKLPDLLFVIDVRKEKNAVKEAEKTNIPIVAVVDTNCDPEPIQYPIVANDDSPQAIEYLIGQILEPYGKTKKTEKSKL